MIIHKNVDKLIAGDTVFLDGNFTENKNVIKAKLKSLGIEVKLSFDDSVTHLILARNPLKGWNLLTEFEVKYVTESQLYQIIREVNVDDKFLVQEEKKGENQLSDNVKSMLINPDIDTVKIALLMIKNGGLPIQLAEELLIVSKTNSDVKVRNESKKILLTQGPPAWFNLLNDKQVFSNIDTLKQKETKAKLENTAKSAGSDDAAFLSYLLFKYFGRGGGYALTLKRNLWRIETLKLMTKGYTLDFTSGVGYHNWKENPDEAYFPSQKINTGISFPSDHPDPLQIKVLNLHNCKISSISNEIVVFANCEEVDASHNVITSIHPSFTKLSKLKRLNLSSNKIVEFPTALCKFKTLEFLDIRQSRYQSNYTNIVNPIQIPPEFLINNPNCEILK